jgi:hypothetical protein
MLEVDPTTMQEEWTDLDEAISELKRGFTSYIQRCNQRDPIDNDHKAPLYDNSRIQSDGN